MRKSGKLLIGVNFGLGALNAIIAIMTNNLFSATAAGFCVGVGFMQLLMEIFLARW